MSPSSFCPAAVMRLPHLLLSGTPAGKTHRPILAHLDQSRPVPLSLKYDSLPFDFRIQRPGDSEALAQPATRRSSGAKGPTNLAVQPQKTVDITRSIW
ncbi:MAG: hypothetical protein VYA69_10390 [Gemmatimonadota bacterium]|nr:hypothetical protein [Gemmatimonadota bacterium]